jgi:hypothetical protein
MTDNTPASLVYVAESSLSDLRQHLRNLPTAPPKVVPTLLKAVREVSDVLSLSLDRLSHYTDTLDGSEEQAPVGSEPETDRGLLMAAIELNKGITRGFCPVCGGIARVG